MVPESQPVLNRNGDFQPILSIQLTWRIMVLNMFSTSPNCGYSLPDGLNGL